MKNHVERDVFVASAARLDNVDALPGQLHLFLRHTRGVETDERLDQPSLGRRVYVQFPSCWHWSRFRFRHAEFLRLASEVLAQTGFIERPARAGELGVVYVNAHASCLGCSQCLRGVNGCMKLIEAS